MLGRIISVHFQCHGAVKIDVDRFVSDPHRTATQLDRFPAFACHKLIVLESLQLLFRCRLQCVPRSLAGLNPASKTLAKHAYRTECHRSESSLPQVGQVRRGLRTHGPNRHPQPQPNATPRSTEWCEIGQRYPLANDGPASIASLCVQSRLSDSSAY
jgi:hypothetical protein